MSSVIEIVLQGTDQSASSAVGGLNDKLGGLASIAGGVLAGGLAVAAVGLTAVAGGIAYSVSQAIDAQKVQAQLAAVLKSTGGQAGVTADAANSLATSLMNASTFSKDTILAGENMLLTFTNIGKDVFPQATQSLVDLSTAMGTDPKTAAIQLGKALNDPIKGITALTRVGVTFTDAQKAVIKHLQDTGDMAGAQKIILAELTKEFGGSAQAQAGTFAGQMAILQNNLQQVAVQIGTALLPILTALVSGVITPALPIIERFGSLIAQFFTDVSNGGDAFGNLKTNLDAILIKLNVPANVRDGIISTITNFIDYARTQGPTALKEIVTALQPLIAAVFNVAQAFISSMPMIQTYVNKMVQFVLGLFRQMSPELITNVSTTLNNIATFWNEHGNQIMAIVSFAFNFIATTIGVVLVLISGIIANFTNVITGNWSGFWATIQSTYSTVMNMILGLVGTNLDSFLATWKGDFELAQTIIQKVWQIISDTISQKVTEFKTTIATGVADVQSNIQYTFDSILTGLRGTFGEFVSVGTGIIDGIKSGIGNAVGGLVSAAVDAAQQALAAVKNALGIHSPSTVFGEIGKNIMAGMSMGITQGTQGTVNTMQNSTNQIVNNNNYNLAIHSNANTENVAGDFRTMQTLFGGI